MDHHVSHGIKVKVRYTEVKKKNEKIPETKTNQLQRSGKMAQQGKSLSETEPYRMRSILKAHLDTEGEYQLPHVVLSTGTSWHKCTNIHTHTNKLVINKIRY